MPAVAAAEVTAAEVTAAEVAAAEVAAAKVAAADVTMETTMKAWCPDHPMSCEASTVAPAVAPAVVPAIVTGAMHTEVDLRPPAPDPRRGNPSPTVRRCIDIFIWIYGPGRVLRTVDIL